MYMFLSCTLVHRVIELTYIQFRCKTSEVVARYRMNSPLQVLNLHTSRFTGARRAMFGRSARARATGPGSETLHVPTMGSRQPRTALQVGLFATFIQEIPSEVGGSLLGT